MSQLKFETTITDTDPFSAVDPVKKTATISYTQKVEQVHSLTTTDAITVWDPANSTSPCTDFDALYMLTDSTNPVYVEMGINTTDAATDAAQFNSFTLIKNYPFILGADDAYSDHTTGAAFAATLDTIDKIRILNPTTSTTVNVRIVLVT